MFARSVVCVDSASMDQIVCESSTCLDFAVTHSVQSGIDVPVQTHATMFHFKSCNVNVTQKAVTEELEINGIQIMQKRFQAIGLPCSGV